MKSDSNHSIQFQVLAPEQHNRWDEFVEICPQGTLFHTTWWYRAWRIEPTVHVIYGDDEQIQAGICLNIGRKIGVKSTVRPPLTPCNGPLFLPSRKHSRHHKNTHAKNMLLMTIRSLPMMGMYDLILRPEDRDVLPYLWNGFESHVCYTHVIPCKEQGNWLQQASKTQQWSIRKANRDVAEGKYTLDESPPISAVASLLAATANFKGFSSAHYSSLLSVWWKDVTDRGVGKAYLLRDDEGNTISTALMVWDSRCAYYVSGGIRPDFRKRSLANVLVIHRMIENAHAMNLDFDFEGSILPGVERFFRSFGAEMRPLYRVVKLPSWRAFVTWQAYHYFSKHRKRQWLSSE